MQRVHSVPHFSPGRARRPAPWKAPAGKSLHTKSRLQPLVPTHAPLGRGRSAHVRDLPTRAADPFAIRSRPRRRAIEQRLVGGVGPAARARWERSRGRGPAGRSGLRLAEVRRGVAEGGGPRVEPEAAGFAAARSAPESRRPRPRTWACHRPCRHEPLQGVQVPAYRGPAAPP